VVALERGLGSRYSRRLTVSDSFVLIYAFVNFFCRLRSEWRRSFEYEMLGGAIVNGCSLSLSRACLLYDSQDGFVLIRFIVLLIFLFEVHLAVFLPCLVRIVTIRSNLFDLRWRP
jgi:hypothetical protein